MRLDVAAAAARRERGAKARLRPALAAKVSRRDWVRGAVLHQGVGVKEGQTGSMAWSCVSRAGAMPQRLGRSTPTADGVSERGVEMLIRVNYAN